jgi:hypothetical protein
MNPLIKYKYPAIDRPINANNNFASIKEAIEDARGRNLLTHPEYHHFVKVPWQAFISIRYTLRRLKSLSTELHRRDYINDLFFGFNRLIKERYPDLPKGKPLSYVRVNEHGADCGSVHTHLLLHIHPKHVAEIKDYVFGLWEGLSVVPPSGAEQVHVLPIVGDQNPYVSYFCKIEKKLLPSGEKVDEFYKHFAYSHGFLSIIESKYPLIHE